MANATNQQVQTFVDQQVRPFCENLRALNAQALSMIAQITDIYNALNQQSPTWSDTRTDGPPHLMLPSDVLAINTVLHNFTAYVAGESQYPIVQQACVRPVPGN